MMDFVETECGTGKTASGILCLLRKYKKCYRKYSSLGSNGEAVLIEKQHEIEDLIWVHQYRKDKVRHPKEAEFWQSYAPAPKHMGVPFQWAANKDTEKGVQNESSFKGTPTPSLPVTTKIWV